MLRKLPILLLAGVMLSGCQQQQLQPGITPPTRVENGGSELFYNRTTTVLTNTPTRIAAFKSSINMDCSFQKDLIVRVVGEPEHGKVVLKDAMEFPRNIALNGPLAKCMDKRTFHIEGVYTSQLGYAGVDHVSFDAFNTTKGVHTRVDVILNVQP